MEQAGDQARRKRRERREGENGLRRLMEQAGDEARRKRRETSSREGQGLRGAAWEGAQTESIIIVIPPTPT